MKKVIVVIASSVEEQTGVIYWVRSRMPRMKGAKDIDVKVLVNPKQKSLKEFHDSSECRYFFILSGQIRCGHETVVSQLFKLAPAKIACLCIRDLEMRIVPEALREKVIAYSAELPACATEELVNFVSQTDISRVVNRVPEPRVLSATG